MSTTPTTRAAQWLSKATKALDQQHDDNPKGYAYELLQLLHQYFEETDQILEEERKARQSLSTSSAG